jgi:hydroxymethylglutaryl-CoA reductase (NADPH)
MTERKIPRSRDDDYSNDAAAARRKFVADATGAQLEHVGHYSLRPDTLPGNIEHFTGVAQVPIGVAGPLLVNGEHAQGEYFVPLATTEGTLVASYNRGMKLLRAAGGVTTTVVDDAMQRAPAFLFDNARQARDFGAWVVEHFAEIKAEAEKTTRSGKLRDIEQYSASRFRYLRFNYTTGDAAGQNMVGRATKAACDWMQANYKGPLQHYFLAANFDTDKKASRINTLRTRGKRVVAEALIPDRLLREIMNTDAATLFKARLVSQLGGFMSGVVNNGAHSANAITAIFIATGQDVANVAESSAAMVHGEVTRAGDYYYSITIPSLIVATHGGGTGLATQRECLQMLGCVGPGKVYKFAEIVAATVLCGELSLGSAIVADEWVSSHEQYGRNR